jgi:hypothetical protein
MSTDTNTPTPAPTPSPANPAKGNKQGQTTQAAKFSSAGRVSSTT